MSIKHKPMSTSSGVRAVSWTLRGINIMNKALSLFPSPYKPAKKPILLVDGDQGIELPTGYQQIYSRVIIVVVIPPGSLPKIYTKQAKHSPEIVKIHCVHQFNVGCKGKETTDKYIGVLMQQLIDQGQQDFHIASNDADFGQIANMLVTINEDKVLNFELLVQKNRPSKRLKELPSTITYNYL